MKAINSRICSGEDRHSKFLEDGAEKFHQRQNVPKIRKKGVSGKNKTKKMIKIDRMDS